MIINHANLQTVTAGFKTVYQQAFDGTPTLHERIAMTIPSNTAREEYGWLGQFPQLREWLGERHINNLRTFGFTIVNRDFETTISVPRNDLEDDRIGLFKPMFEELGRAAKMHPDSLIFELLKNGFSTNCYDGQFFFDTDHPLYDGRGDVVGSVSNLQAGSGTPWYLLDLSRAIKPIIWQQRQPYRLAALDDPRDENVFMRKEFIYGVDTRSNAGFGLWQLASASKEALNKTNFVAARTAMSAIRGDKGGLLGIRPTHLLVPPSLEETARELFKPNLAGGESNIWEGAVEIIVSHHVA